MSSPGSMDAINLCDYSHTKKIIVGDINHLRY